LVRRYLTVEVDGAKREAFVVGRVRVYTRRKVVNGKTYEWEDRKIVVYVPKRFSRSEYFIVVPLSPEELPDYLTASYG